MRVSHLSTQRHIAQTVAVDELLLTEHRYDSARGVVATVEGGTVTVEIANGAVEIFGDPAGLRDLARWCLALSDETAPDGSHIHLDPGTIPLASVVHEARPT